ncbi:hypothetical protein HD806DRAFT_551833 [Xylariaceae sp. AK1471]|nr:hypothetical protein HD806DRAFT_551833 [Xylariaceae sp. AK1471]
MFSNASLAPAQAKALVETIANYHGYLGEDVYAGLPEENRLKVMKAFHMKDVMIGAGVITLAKNLYTSNSRFVFEMLQNADDNHFTRARDDHEDPYVTFKIAPSYITVECNEDGFIPANLKAICAIGESSKASSQGYIGEKGIGFKSVFMAAYKVHIQSGSFSFSFHHRPGDSGMGMISPTWEDTQDVPPSGITRIKLFLHDDMSYATNKSVLQQFEDIQATHLLFMRNLRCINIIFVNSEDLITSSTKYSTQQITPDRVSVTKQRDGGTEEVANYHVTKHLASNLPRHDNRTYSQADVTARAWSSSEVVLAFRLDENWSNPVVTSQRIFAFLPIRNMGFKFLIQADFVTQANRQDIVTTSGRNQAIREGIAEAFSKAMRELCTYNSLQYKWMRYLPQKDDYPWEEYWKILYNRIKSKIIAAPLMRPLSEASLYKIGQIRRLPVPSLDDSGDPIFSDTAPESYLSKNYAADDLDSLQNYGLQWIDIGGIIVRASKDLSNPNSRIKSATTSDQWHTAAAKLLCLPFEKHWEKPSQDVRALELIPLENGKWTNATTKNSLSFTSTNGFTIPQDLSFTFISSSAVKNAERANLFKHLGAQEPSVSLIRRMIINKYPAVINQELLFGKTDRPEEISLAHLRFLYLTHHEKTVNAKSYQHIAVFVESKVLKAPLSQDVYISNEHRYGPKTLLRSTNDAPGLQVDFLSSSYLIESQSQGQPVIDDDWLRWLQNILSIRSHIRVIDDDKFTVIFDYIMKFRTDEVPGFLQYYWPSIGKDICKRPSLKEQIADHNVSSNGWTRRFRQTYLPLPSLTSCCSRYLDDITSFPFLGFENTLAPNDLSAWTFLQENFGVGALDDIPFYMEILSGMSEADCNLEYGQSVPMKVFDLYKTLYGKIVAMDDTKTDTKANKDRVRMAFSWRDLILLPEVLSEQQTGRVRWMSSGSCRWDCPINMKTVKGLQSHYEGVLGDVNLKNTVVPFMRNTVGVKDLSCDDIIEELRSQQTGEDQDEGIIQQMYERLAGLMSKDSKPDQKIKETFQTEALIFAAGKWHTAPACVWSSLTNIPGRVALNTQYPKKETLFVKFLGVPTLTLEMAYFELQRKGTSDATTVSEMKQELQQFNSLLLEAESKLDPSPVLKARVFPVKFPDGSVQLLSASSSDFAIIDRKALGEKFAGLAKILDLTLDEVHRFQPFIHWAGLDERYLSVKVTETTAPVGGDENLQESRRSIKQRAYALCRIAVHFKSSMSQDPKTLYQVLKRSRVLETESISSELHIVENGNTIRILQDQAELHIDSTDNGLKIYVPKDSDRQDLCFLLDLPVALFKWMMSENISKIDTRKGEVAKRLVTNILALNTGPSALRLLLDKEGIIDLDFPEDNAESDEGHSKGSLIEAVVQEASCSHSITEEHGSVTPTNWNDDDNVGTETPLSSIFSGPSPMRRQRHGQDYGDSFYHARSRTPEPSTYRRPSSSNISSTQTPHPYNTTPRPTVPSQASTSQSEGDTNRSQGSSYITLLDNVIKSARAATFPRKEPFSMSAMKASLDRISGIEPPDDYFELPSAGGVDRDKMIGAAGELYVFELLSAHNPQLPHFIRALWQSAIKKYVTVHPEYETMPPWKDRETADIVYSDFSGILTTAFIDNGYLSEKKWKGRKPMYYIEVKTTRGACEMPFFVSKNQYNMMHETSSESKDGKGQDAIYVIFRVFNLGRESMGCAIYLDPRAMETHDSLKFTPVKWSVAPGSSSSYWMNMY